MCVGGGRGGGGGGWGLVDPRCDSRGGQALWKIPAVMRNVWRLKLELIMAVHGWPGQGLLSRGGWLAEQEHH